MLTEKNQFNTKYSVMWGAISGSLEVKIFRQRPAVSMKVLYQIDETESYSEFVSTCIVSKSYPKHLAAIKQTGKNF